MLYRLRVVELERAQEKQYQTLRNDVDLANLERNRVREMQRDSSQLRRSLDDKDLMRIQMNQQAVLSKSESLLRNSTVNRSSESSFVPPSAPSPDPCVPNLSHSPERLSKESVRKLDRIAHYEEKGRSDRSTGILRSGSRIGSFDNIRGELSPTGEFELQTTNEVAVSPTFTSPTTSPALRMSGNRFVEPEKWDPQETVTGSALGMSSTAVDREAMRWLGDSDGGEANESEGNFAELESEETPEVENIKSELVSDPTESRKGDLLVDEVFKQKKTKVKCTSLNVFLGLIFFSIRSGRWVSHLILQKRRLLEPPQQLRNGTFE